jgi:hypothetical protein
MSEKHPKAVGVYLLVGFMVGSLVGIAAYGITQWVPVIAFGPLLGFIVALALSRFSYKKP